MAEPYIGEIRVYSFNFAPRGWAMCRGQLLAINQNQALFSLLGTQFGGNGQTTFALPNLRNRVALGLGPQAVMGQQMGSAIHTLSISEMPAHSHALVGTSARVSATTPVGKVFATNPALANQGTYGSVADGQAHPDMIATSGGSQPHENSQPFLTLNPCIALVGIFPSRD